MKSKKYLKLISSIFLTILFDLISDFLPSFTNSQIDISMLGTKEYLSMFGLMLIMVIFYIIKSILNMYWLVAIYIGIKIAYKKYYKEKLGRFDLKDDTYYREIISSYYPGVLSYIDNLVLDKKDIVATLM